MLDEPGQWPASETPPLDEQEIVKMHSPYWPLLTMQVWAKIEERPAN